MFFDCRPKILHKHCLQFLLGVKMAPRENGNNAYAKFWGDKQRTLWYVIVFLEWSIEAQSPEYSLVKLKISKQFLPLFTLYGRLSAGKMTAINIKRGNSFFFTLQTFFVLNLVSLTILYGKRLI